MTSFTLLLHRHVLLPRQFHLRQRQRLAGLATTPILPVSSQQSDGKQQLFGDHGESAAAISTRVAASFTLMPSVP